MHIFLLRHGADTRGSGSGTDPDPDLTPTGHRQAAAAADWLASQPVNHLVSGNSLRAVQTAAAVAARTGLVSGTDWRLNEVDHAPDRPAGRPRPALPGPALPPRLRPSTPGRPGGESWHEFVGRVASFVSELCLTSAAADGHVLVTHSGVFDALLEGLTGGSAAARVELAVSHGGITHWEYRPAEPGGPWRLHAHNSTGHLAPAPGWLA